MSSRPKPQVLDDGRVVELSHCPSAGWTGHITDAYIRPGVARFEDCWQTTVSYPNVRTLRSALIDGTAEFQNVAAAMVLRSLSKANEAV